MPLFEVAILESPSKKDLEEGRQEKLVLGPEFVVAKSDQSAAMLVVMDNADKLAGLDRDRIMVLIRPFA